MGKITQTSYGQLSEGQSKTREISRSQEHAAGLYRHPEAKNPDGTPVEVITLEDPLFGNAQSEGIVRLGFVRVSDAPEGSIKTLPELHWEASASQTSDMKGLAARLDNLESKGLEKDKEIERLKAELAKAQEEKTPEDLDTSAPEKALDAQNRTELEATAKAEGVEVTEDLDTKKKLAAAIQAKRDEKKGE